MTLGPRLIDPFLKDVVRGIVIVAAVAVYSRREVVSRRARFGPGGTAIAPDPGGVPAEPAGLTAVGSGVTPIAAEGSRK